MWTSLNAHGQVPGYRQIPPDILEELKAKVENDNRKHSKDPRKVVEPGAYVEVTLFENLDI